MAAHRHEHPAQRWWRSLFTWANALRVFGAAGFVTLLAAEGTERPTYMIACIGLMGAPTFWNKDQKDADG